MDIGAPELIIIAVIILLLFGPGKAADLGSSLGKSIREFRKSVKEDDEMPSTPGGVSASTAGSPADASVSVQRCGACNAEVRGGQKFCANCGTAVVPPVASTRDAASL